MSERRKPYDPEIRAVLKPLDRIQEVSTSRVFEVMQVGHREDDAEPSPVKNIYKVRDVSSHELREVKDADIGEGKLYEIIGPIP